MVVPITFICKTCARANQERGWADYEDEKFYSLTETWEHMRLNPSHEIVAEAEVEIHI